MIAAIIFDMDGVLIDSEPLSLEATNVVLARRGHALDEAANESYLGWNQLRYWTDLKGRFGLEADVEELMREREAAFVVLLGEKLPIAPGLVDLLDELAEFKLPLAVASSSGREMIEHVLAEGGIADYFDEVVSGEDVAEPKPAPDIFLRTAELLGVEPRSCLVFEDSKNGVRAAQAAGMKVVRVVTATTKNLEFPTVDLTIAGFEGLDVRKLGVDLAQASGGDLFEKRSAS